MVIPLDLHMADGWAEGGAANVAHRQLGNLVVKVNKPFNDNRIRGTAGAIHGILPGGIHLGCGFHHALPLAG